MNLCLQDFIFDLLYLLTYQLFCQLNATYSQQLFIKIVSLYSYLIDLTAFYTGKAKYIYINSDISE